jgi:hypothetical protein
MSQKNRNDLVSAVSTNLHNNSNKEITAASLRDVINDLIESKFNVIDDELKSMKYNSTQSLEQHLSSVVGSVPLWGSTDFFDPSSSTGSIESYSDSGIVSSMAYQNPSNERSEITVNFSESIADRKLSISIYTELGKENAAGESNYTSPVISRFHSKQIKIGLRELGGYVGKIRLEILAFKINN